MSFANAVPMVATIKTVLSGKVSQYRGHRGHSIVNVIFVLENGIEVPFTFRTYISGFKTALSILKGFAVASSNNDLVGRKVRVLYDRYARNEDKICGIGHLTYDTWFSPSQVCKADEIYTLSEFKERYKHS